MNAFRHLQEGTGMREVFNSIGWLLTKLLRCLSSTSFWNNPSRAVNLSLLSGLSFSFICAKNFPSSSNLRSSRQLLPGFCKQNSTSISAGMQYSSHQPGLQAQEHRLASSEKSATLTRLPAQGTCAHSCRRHPTVHSACERWATERD